MCVSTFQFFMGARYLISLSHGEKVTPIQEKRGRPLFYFIFLIVMECILTGEEERGVGFPITCEWPCPISRIPQSPSFREWKDQGSRECEWHELTPQQCRI